MSLIILGTDLAPLRNWPAASAVLGFALAVAPVWAQGSRSCSEIEALMRKTDIRILAGERALMDDGTMQHPVFVHMTDEAYRTGRRRDTWKANVAAYELAKILEIYIIPPYVEVEINGKHASASWGLDNVIMNAVQRLQRNVQPPDPEAFNKQMAVVRVFDELVNHGRAPSDLLITKDWQLWIIGPSQGFLPATTVDPANLVRCDRRLLAKLRTINRAELMSKLAHWLTKEEVDALNMRAARIVKFFDREVASKGETAVLFELDRTRARCAL